MLCNLRDTQWHGLELACGVGSLSRQKNNHEDNSLSIFDGRRSLAGFYNRRLKGRLEHGFVSPIRFSRKQILHNEDCCFVQGFDPSLQNLEF